MITNPKNGKLAKSVNPKLKYLYHFTLPIANTDPTK